jgi:hypothetical protein
MEASNDFNRGFVSALALYYAHRMEQTSTRAEDGAQHLIDFRIPRQVPMQLRDKLLQFRRKAIDEPDEKRFDECMDLLIEIDRVLYKIDAYSKYM